MANKEVVYSELKEIASDLGKGTVTLIKGIGYATIPFLECIYHYKTAKKEINVDKDLFESWQIQLSIFSFFKGACEGAITSTILYKEASNYFAPAVCLGISYSILSAIGTYNALRLGRRVGQSESESESGPNSTDNPTSALETIVVIPADNSLAAEGQEDISDARKSNLGNIIKASVKKKNNEDIKDIEVVDYKSNARKDKLSTILKYSVNKK